MAAMDVDQEVAEFEDSRQPLPVLSLPVLQTIRTAQAQHGLRHNDHARYREYCTRKLRRLYRAHNLTHGRGKFVRRTLEPNSTTDSGHLLIPLVSAERAWALAQALKAELEKGKAPRKRLHLIKRLAKATRHAHALAFLASQRADARTALEAEAYASLMAGTWLMEKESDWTAALKKLTRARQICEELAKVGTADQVAVTQQQLTELEPMLRYSQYQLQRRGKGAADALVPDSPSASALQARLNALAEETPQADQAGAARGASIFSWRGTAYPVQSERVRTSLAAAAEVSTALSRARGEDERLAALDKQIAAYNEAKGFIRHALSTTAGSGAASDAQTDLRALNAAVTGAQLEATLERGCLAVSKAETALDQALRGSSSTGTSVAGSQEVKPQDVIRIYDNLGGSCKEFGEVAAQLGGSAGELLQDEASAKAAQFQACRCYYAAHAYLAGANPTAAYALFARAADRADSAITQHQDCATVDEQACARLEQLKQTALAWRCTAQAECAAQKQQEVDEARDGVEAISLEGVAPAKGYLLDELERWEAFAGEPGQEPRLFPVPPRLDLIPMRPFLLDAAQSFITAPSLEHRLQPQQKAGGIASLFGWRK